MQCVEDNLRFGRTHNTKPELTALLEAVVRRRHFRRGLRTAFENSPIRSLVPALLSARQCVRRLTGLVRKPALPLNQTPSAAENSGAAKRRSPRDREIHATARWNP